MITKTAWKQAQMPHFMRFNLYFKWKSGKIFRNKLGVYKDRRTSALEKSISNIQRFAKRSLCPVCGKRHQ
jgi:hypothetical protein